MNFLQTIKGHYKSLYNEPKKINVDVREFINQNK